MKRELVSELRTLYETTDSSPNTFRVTITLKEAVDGEIFESAVKKTMKRYPFFGVQLVCEDERCYFAENDRDFVVRDTDDIITLGTEESNFHLMAFAYKENRIYLDAHHGFADGGAMGDLYKTLLYYYCSEAYKADLSSEGIFLSDSPILEAEWEDPYRTMVKKEPVFEIRKWAGTALQIADDPKVTMKERAIVHHVRIDEKEFMRFNISKEGSPGTVLALFMALAIDRLNPGAADPVCIAMCVNQRKALRAPCARKSLVGGVSLVYKPSMKKMSFEEQVTCFRGMVALQSDSDYVLEEISEYLQWIDEVEALSTVEERKAKCVEKVKERSKHYTAAISYVGKSSMGDAERFVERFDVHPSTAYPSVETPVIVEVLTVNDKFYVSFIQYFEQTDYFDAFLEQMKINDIQFEVLDSCQARYPEVKFEI